jgi:hypothetical protein
MNCTARSKLLVATALCAATFATAAAQDASAPPQEKPIDPQTTTRLTLGSTSGTPGTSTVVPVYFTPAGNAAAGRLRFEVTFVSRNLKFTKLDAGIAAELGNIELQTDLRESKNEEGLETSTLAVVATAPASEPKGIPAGLLGYLTFQILESARPAVISLRASAEAAQSGSGTPLADVRAFGAQVEVMAPGEQPAVACFFFSH